MMARRRFARPTYKIVDREYHNETYDLLHVEIKYPNRGEEKGRHIKNRYLVLKHEKVVPKPMKDRKFDTITLDGEEWIDRRMTRKDFANRRRRSDDLQD